GGRGTGRWVAGAESSTPRRASRSSCAGASRTPPQPPGRSDVRWIAAPGDVGGMSKGARLLGVDLLKGLAAYGVVVIHSLGRQPRTAATESFVGLFLGFSVPYFLAASLFLTCGKLLATGPQGFLRGRVERLIVPYLVWTAIFVAVRSALYAATGRADDLRSLWGSPLSVLFLGVASAQLYFIPLLFVGELLAVALVSALGDRLRRPAVV